MSQDRIKVVGRSITRAQLRVLRAIDEAVATPKIGVFHRMTELHLEKQRYIRRVAHEPGSRVPGWSIAKSGRRVLDALAEEGNLPARAEALGRSYEPI